MEWKLCCFIFFICKYLAVGFNRLDTDHLDMAEVWPKSDLESLWCPRHCLGASENMMIFTLQLLGQ